MSEKIINRLPSVTWGWLKVNDAKVKWDDDKCIFQGDTDIESTGKYVVSSDDEYSAKSFTIKAKENDDIEAYFVYEPKSNMSVKIDVEAKASSNVKIVIVNLGEEDSLLVSEINGKCEKKANIDIIECLPAKGNIYVANNIDLTGDESTTNIDIAYLGQNNDRIDINTVVNQIGKETASNINVSGALRDASHKTFKGTIDFKTGSTDSKGNEVETVLMLGEDVVNKSVPVILCAEENVAGNHGATIGELDDELLFYFESRGIDRKKAEKILARAAFDRLKGFIRDEEINERISKKIEEVL